ncbi:MAG: pyridoxamine 5'-phosphate oxidase family protein [Eubacteriales bacterium]
MSQSQEHLHEKIHTFLRQKDTGALATTGVEMRVSPVKYYVDERSNIYIHSDGGKKFDNIQKNHNVCLLISTEFSEDLNKIKGIQVFGHCEVGENGSSLYEEAERFCPWNHDNDTTVIKITPDHIVYKDGITEDGSKQVWYN